MWQLSFETMMHGRWSCHERMATPYFRITVCFTELRGPNAYCSIIEQIIIQTHHAILYPQIISVTQHFTTRLFQTCCGLVKGVWIAVILTSDSYQYQVWKLCHCNKAPIITEFLQKKGIIFNEILNSGVEMLNLTFQKIRTGTPS